MTNGKGQTKRTRWTSEVARQELGQWRASGLPLEAYARQRGLVAQRLRWWRQQLGVDNVAPRPRVRPRWLPVTVRTGATDAADTAVVVELDGVGRLQVREVSSATAAWVGVVLATMREPRA
jgi:hypothetical protein